MADRWAPVRVRRYAALLRRERAMAAAIKAAIDVLLAASRSLLAGSGWNPDVLDNRTPVWRAALEKHIAPEVAAAYVAALEGEAREGTEVDAGPHAARHLANVTNRLVDVADTVFDVMRAELTEGMAAGESIPELAARVDALLADGQRWKNRATVVARTEVIAANNAGSREGARQTALALDVAPAKVRKVWLSTPGTRTRPTHREGQVAPVMGIDTRFHVGDSELLQPGDPAGAAGEVIQCRCSALYLMPGDPGYDDDNLTAAGGAQLDDAPQEDTVTAASPETEAQVIEDTNTEQELTWSGVLAPEGVVTGDKRKFADGAITWLGTPGVLKAMFADAPGHDASVPVGLITAVERRDGRLWARGTWDTGSQAVEARRQNIAGLLRGVSVDLDAAEVSFEDADGNALEGDDMFAMDVEPTMVVTAGRLRAATLWCMPAYVEAYILDSTVADQVPDLTIQGADGQTGLGLAASALYTPADTARFAPAEAFANPGLTEPTTLTVTDDGRVFGHLACWGVCHIGIDGACVTPPTSDTDYAHFLTGMYPTSDGQAVPVGTLTIGTGHADLNLALRPTVDHYDNTGTQAAYVNMGEDEHGIWFAGVLHEDLPTKQLLAMQRSGSISGDWRNVAGNLELCAALVVNVPGFPIPTVKSRVASAAGQTALVASGVLPHPQTPATVGGVDYRVLAREVAAYQARQARLDATTRRLRKHRQTALAARITTRKG